MGSYRTRVRDKLKRVDTDGAGPSAAAPAAARHQIGRHPQPSGRRQSKGEEIARANGRAVIASAR
jgi:hypothetical protein